MVVLPQDFVLQFGAMDCNPGVDVEFSSNTIIVIIME